MRQINVSGRPLGEHSNEFLAPALDQLVVTDAVPAFRLASSAAREKVEVLPVAPLLAEIIRRLHARRGLADLQIL